MKARKTRSKQKAKKSQLAIVDGVSSRKNDLLTIPKSAGLIVSDRIFTKLEFWSQKIIPIAASTSAGVRYTPSSAYDIDPLVGSAAMPGFAEMAALFAQYRVTVSDIEVMLVNPLNTYGADILVGPLNVDPGASATDAFIVSCASNPYFALASCGCVGSPPARVTASMSTEKIYGSKMVYSDDNFSSATNTSPNNNWYWFVAVSVSATISLRIRCGVEFFDRRQLLN